MPLPTLEQLKIQNILPVGGIKPIIPSVGTATLKPLPSLNDLKTQNILPQTGFSITQEPKTEIINDGISGSKSRTFFQPKILENRKDDNPVMKVLKGITNFVISPFVPLGEDIGQIIALNEISKGVAEGKYPVQVLDEFDILKKTAPQIVGDVAQSVLMATPFGRAESIVVAKLPLLSKMALGAKTGAVIGGSFGVAGTLSEKPKPTIPEVALGGIAGAAIGAAVGAVAVPITEKVADIFMAARGQIRPTVEREAMFELAKAIPEEKLPRSTFVQRAFPGLYEKRLMQVGEEIFGEAYKNTPKLNVFESLLKPALPIRALTTKDPIASYSRIQLENATLKQKNVYSTLYDKSWQDLNKLDEDALSKVVGLQEKGAKLSKDKVLNVGLKNLRLQEEKTFALAKQLGVDTGAWRYTPENHFSHLWRGQQVIFDETKVGRKTTREIVGFAEDRVDGLRKLLEYKARFPASNPVLRPRTEIWKASQPTTALSQKGFWSFINKIAKFLETTPDDALEEISMQGIAKIRPSKTTIGVFKWRKGELGNYLTDPKKVYPSIWYKITKAIHLDPVLRTEALRVSKIANPEIKGVMQDLVDVLAGKYQRQSLPYGVTSKITGIQAQFKLGLRVSPPIVNIFQRFYGIALTGEKNFALAQKNVFTKEGQAILAKLGTTAEAPLYETMGRQITKKWYNPLYLFGQTEGGKYIGNRAVVPLAGYYKGLKMDLGLINSNLKKVGLPLFKSQEELALMFGRQINNSTQFVYDIVGAPAVMRNNLGRVFLQFKTYGVNMMTNTAYILGGKPLPGLELFYPKGLSRTQAIHQAVIHFGTMFSQGGIRALSWGMERFLPPATLTWMVLKAPWLLYGVASFSGVDVSRSSTVELANFTNTLPTSDANNVWKAIKEKNPKYLLNISPAAYRIYRAIEATGEEGWLKNIETGEKVVKLTPIELLEYGVGINPLKVSAEQDLHWQETRRRTELNELTVKGKDDLIIALRNRDFELAQNILLNLKKSGIEIRTQDLIKELKEDELSRIQRDFLKVRKSEREEFLKRYQEYIKKYGQ